MPSAGLQQSPMRPWRRRQENSLASRSSQFSKSAGILWVLANVCWYSLLSLGVGVLALLTIHYAFLGNDFCQDYASVVSLLHGHTAYPTVHCNASYRYLPGGVEYDSHPPTSILLFIPFGYLPEITATILWGLLSLAAYLASGWLLIRTLRWPVLPGLALFAFGSLFWGPSIQVTEVLNLEQVLLLLLVGVWLLARRRQDNLAGILLGIACLLKIWPVIFLVLPLLQRRWRLATVTMAVVLAGILLALLVEGPSAFLAYAEPVRIAEDGWIAIAYAGNVSLTGLVVGLVLGYRGTSHRQAPTLLGIHVSTAILAGEILSAVLVLGFIGLLWWKRRSLQGEMGDLVGFGLLVTLVVVAFPLTWPWGLISLLLPAAALVLAFRHQLSVPRWWWWLLAASQVLLNLELVPLVPVIRHIHPVAVLEATFPTVGLLLFLAAQAYLVASLPQQGIVGADSQPSTAGDLALTVQQVESPAKQR